MELQLTGSTINSGNTTELEHLIQKLYSSMEWLAEQLNYLILTWELEV